MHDAHQLTVMCTRAIADILSSTVSRQSQILDCLETVLMTKNRDSHNYQNRKALTVDSQASIATT